MVLGVCPSSGRREFRVLRFSHILPCRGSRVPHNFLKPPATKLGQRFGRAAHLKPKVERRSALCGASLLSPNRGASDCLLCCSLRAARTSPHFQLELLAARFAGRGLSLAQSITIHMHRIARFHCSQSPHPKEIKTEYEWGGQAGPATEPVVSCRPLGNSRASPSFTTPTVTAHWKVGVGCGRIVNVVKAPCFNSSTKSQTIASPCCFLLFDS